MAVLKCLTCGSEDLNLLVDMGRHPASTFLQDEYIVDPFRFNHFRYNICNRCSHVQVAFLFDSKELYFDYPRVSSFQQPDYYEKLGKVLLEVAAIEDRILEIGCGDGAFGQSLLGMGFENVLGLDPSVSSCHAAKGRGVDVVHGFF